MEKIVFDYKGKNIEYSIWGKNWTISVLNDPHVPKMSDETLKAIAPDMWAEIANLLPQKIEEYEETEKLRKADEERKQDEIKQNKIRVLKGQVMPLIEGTDLKLEVDRYGDGFELTSEKITVRAEFSVNVYSGLSFYSHKTDKPWIVHGETRIRYSTLEKAVAAMKRIITKKIEDTKLVQKQKEDEQKRENDLREKMGTYSISLEKEDHGYHNQWDHHKWYSHMVYLGKVKINDKLWIEGTVNEKIGTKESVISNPTIKGILTLEQFKDLANFVKALVTEEVKNV